jgi:hypothetical protein
VKFAHKTHDGVETREGFMQKDADLLVKAVKKSRLSVAVNKDTGDKVSISFRSSQKGLFEQALKTIVKQKIADSLAEKSFTFGVICGIINTGNFH